MIPGNLSAVGTAMANHLWQSTLFALLAGMATLALRKNQARVRHHLWLAASLKFLLPFSLLMDLGGYLARLNGSSETRPVFYFVMQTVSQPFSDAAVSRGLFATSLLRWLPGIAAVVWLIGFVTVIGLWWVRWRRVAAAIRGAAPVAKGRELEALRLMERSAGMQKPIAFRSSQSTLEPGVFGILRPLLLWPAGISEHLQDAHLEAILAHEVQHVRRRDNLAAAMHMVVEAIFWFHPLAWWLGARLVEERERACDEEVLRLGNQPHIYAESILKTCEFCMASPLACVSGVTGADLKQRIVRIMTHGSADKLSFLRKLLLATIGIAAVAGPIVAGLTKAPLATAQSAQTNTQPQPRTADGAEQPIGVTVQKIYHVGADVSAPKLIFAPDPEFTEKARKSKYQGICVISTIVDAQGKPTRVQVVRHLGMGLDKKAVEAVKQYKFEPATRFGKPVAVEVNIEVNFRLY
ncbi:MAG TPA: M56 family metallopeptidase [Acidobacteriaceae bacterium]|nr:M56 family metallopeptidase [Acidobacteriaceae bacterium]